MAGKKTKTLPYQRKRKGKTNYKKRLCLLTAQKPRLVIRFTNRQIIAQLVNFRASGDLVLVGLASSCLKKYQWSSSFKNLPAAYLTGYLLGRKALQKNIKEAVLDLGFKPPFRGNKAYALLKGALDAGMSLPHSPEVFPSKERLAGKHIQRLGPELLVKTKKLIEQEK